MHACMHASSLLLLLILSDYILKVCTIFISKNEYVDLQFWFYDPLANKICIGMLTVMLSPDLVDESKHSSGAD